MEKLDIAGHLVGAGEAPFFIAEIGANHNGDMGLARELIRSAVATGVNAVKFQSWSATSLICKAEFERDTASSDPHQQRLSLREEVEKYQLSPAQHAEIAAYCSEQGVLFLSTAFSSSEVDLLTALEVSAFKVASMDINNLDLLACVGSTGKPIILSTGMSTLGEIERALEKLRASGSGPICLLHCVAIYPPRCEDINLRNIEMLRQAFGVPVGFSDHTRGSAVSLAAVALGACLIEKHFTLNHDMPGWDHGISANPTEMREIVTGGREIYTALGSQKRSVNADEQAKKVTFRRSVVVTSDLYAGHILTHADLQYKRPGNGIHPDETKYIVGRTLKRDLKEDEMLRWEDVI